ncbi:signal peptidase II [Apilactobacillus xinyiensis]|uniref:Lipoprotein signal peptidase n=1 Tax=Apilactobacillus xinyiensis TaxID=2841032 RepID=A0ABT0HZW4_9LACO|nr:signal peptidase II [Apilactobacillus xinyiensis]MCK8624120.1 signal peptidase II [Apilactobacillus xinyiensis]MCL0311712.1 signal peptidase II [Apilactobacillus xinyiensis]MCL0318144.1 signal peptidase II [Apilactobacillus xinyiensis]MCL0329398.1 signal peptidase II [Apilactobacillus xinyiensis]
MPIFLIILCVALVSIDQLIKFWIVNNIDLGSVISFIPGVSLTYLQNTGAAWSMLEGKQIFFYVVSIIAVVAIIYFWIKTKHNLMLQLGLSVVLAGTLGNFIDRIVHTFVVDMFQLDFINFPIFNFADACLTIGFIFIFIGFLKE